MNSLINPSRPPVFCPGCAHEKVIHALDRVFLQKALRAEEVVIVSDIGCSGLFDTFFSTHAFHGLHGRALTYATGLKLARPELTVIVTMGDGGLGIGGAHLLSASRRNLDITLLVMNNFNYGMTGGQFSSTTPSDASVESGFLNKLEKPFDVCEVSRSAGCAFTLRVSAYRKDLERSFGEAIDYHGFSIVDIWGVCPGRYTKKNPITPKKIEQDLERMSPMNGVNIENQRREYGDHYRELSLQSSPFEKKKTVSFSFSAEMDGRLEIMLLGKAGQRIITAAEILSLSAMTAGFHSTQKSDYPITVLRGHSVGEVIISSEPVRFTGIERPAVIFAIGGEGVKRSADIFKGLSEDALVIKASDVDVPASRGRIIDIDFHKHRVKSDDQALYSLGVLSRVHPFFRMEMLKSAISYRFDPGIREKSIALVETAFDASYE